MKKNIFKFAYVGLAIVSMIVLSRSAMADYGQCVAACEEGYTAAETGCENGCYAQYEQNRNFNLNGCISYCTNTYYDIEQECDAGC